jgi:MGT family glycosyltransferase
MHYLPCFALTSGLNGLTPLLNVSRKSLGLEPLDEALGAYEQLLPRCDRVLAVTLRHFDDFDDTAKTLSGIRYVGPIREPDPPNWDWDLPWPPGHSDPLVVASFSTTYQHQEQQLQRTIDALAALPVRSLVTLGPGLDPAEITAPTNVVVRSWIPHDAVLASASLLVTHSGHSTVMNAIAHAVPMICLPTGRDQFVNARRVQECHLGVALEADATSQEIREAVETVLADPTYRAAVADMSRDLHELCADDPAIREIETLLSATHA